MLLIEGAFVESKDYHLSYDFKEIEKDEREKSNENACLGMRHLCEIKQLTYCLTSSSLKADASASDTGDCNTTPCWLTP
jgi:hypothetical protein